MAKRTSTTPRTRQHGPPRRSRPPIAVMLSFGFQSTAYPRTFDERARNHDRRLASSPSPEPVHPATAGRTEEDLALGLGGRRLSRAAPLGLRDLRFHRLQSEAEVRLGGRRLPEEPRARRGQA